MTLFAQAKKEAPKQEAKATKTKVIVPVNLGDKLKRLQDCRNTIATLEAECSMLEGDIKPVAREEFLNLLKRYNRRPDSFVLQSAGSNMLVIIQDKYLKMSETKEKALVDNGLKDVIDEETVYSFDPVLLAKHEKAISAALEKIKTITDEERERLIKADVVKSVKKGTIDRLPTLKDPVLAFNLIEPVVQLKNQ